MNPNNGSPRYSNRMSANSPTTSPKPRTSNVVNYASPGKDNKPG